VFYIADNGIIKLHAGDSGNFHFQINIGSTINPQPYALQANDKIYFSVMEPNQPFELGVLRKILTVDDLIDETTINIQFITEDTERLIPGIYYYEMKLVLIDNEENTHYYTICPKTKFYILD